MKTAIIFLLAGAILGAVALHLYNQRESEESAVRRENAERSQAENPPSADATGDTGDRAKDDIERKLSDWHLTREDIKKDLARTGQVVRTKAQALGEKINDGRIVAVIKAKYLLDRDLSAIDISVHSHDGEVDLGGTVTAPEHIGKAIVLALDTDGVHGVTSKIAVAPK